MKNEEVLVWDTTKFSSDYPKFIKNIYYKCSLKNRKHFSSWIGKANSKFLKDLDWWSASRFQETHMFQNYFITFV